MKRKLKAMLFAGIPVLAAVLAVFPLKESKADGGEPPLWGKSVSVPCPFTLYSATANYSASATWTQISAGAGVTLYVTTVPGTKISCTWFDLGSCVSSDCTPNTPVSAGPPTTPPVPPKPPQ